MNILEIIGLMIIAGFFGYCAWYRIHSDISARFLARLEDKKYTSTIENDFSQFAASCNVLDYFYQKTISFFPVLINYFFTKEKTQ